MYSPDIFKINDKETLFAFLEQHSFATIVSHEGGAPVATHMPVLLRRDKGTLASHMARANPQWKHFANGQEVLVIFTGPHAYISPAWYASKPAVPTWNYTAVHVYGRPRIVSDHDELATMLSELVEFYESSREPRWDGAMPEEFRDGLMRAIVGIEIEITRIEGKFKLSQNRPVDAVGVIEALAASDDQTEREVAELMSRWVPQPIIDAPAK